MASAGQSEAKQLFVDRILAQAAIQGVAFSAAERYVLSRSESDHDFQSDRALTAAF
jgi:hypothetical protein